MTAYRKKDYPLDKIRRFIEPGPIVLLSSSWRGKTNIMTMGWHMMMEFSPALIGCYIWDRNHSFERVRKSKQCVINLPTLELAEKAVGIGNCSGAEIDKFEAFGLTPIEAEEVDAPLIKECYANFECRLFDARQIKQYNLFIWEAVKAHVAISPKNPKTLHYRGDGEFMLAGKTLNLRKKFKPEYL